jgi:hypothetical protein
MDIREDLHARFMRLGAIEAIKQVRAQYYEIYDDIRNRDYTTPLFVQDGIRESLSFAMAKGCSEIRAVFG